MTRKFSKLYGIPCVPARNPLTMNLKPLDAHNPRLLSKSAFRTFLSIFWQIFFCIHRETKAELKSAQICQTGISYGRQAQTKPAVDLPPVDCQRWTKAWNLPSYLDITFGCGLSNIWMSDGCMGSVHCGHAKKNKKSLSIKCIL